MLGLSKQKTIEEHRKMWKWIAEQYLKGRRVGVVSLKHEYISCHTDYSADEIQYVCFCCQYAIEQQINDRHSHNTCHYCPID